MALHVEGTRRAYGAATGSAVEHELNPGGYVCRGVENIDRDDSLTRRRSAGAARADGSRRIDPLIAVEGDLRERVHRNGHVRALRVGVADVRPAQAHRPAADLHTKELKAIYHDGQRRRSARADFDRR